MSFVVRKQSTTTKKLSSPVQISRMQDALDADFGTLNAVQDGRFVAYNDTTKKFNLKTSDDILLESISDNRFPDGFIGALENQISYGGIIPDIDGGTF